MTTSAREHSARLADLLRREHSAMADFLVALADFDRKRLWEPLGHPGLFSFLRRELHLSAGAAQYRKTAAELLQRYPQVEAALRSGQLCLSSVVELGKVIAPDNVEELLPRFFGLSSRDAAAVAASIRPVQDLPRRELVTVLPSGAATAVDAPSSATAPARPPGHGQADDGVRGAASDLVPVLGGPAPGEVRAPELDSGQAHSQLTAQPPSRRRPHPVEVEPLTADLRRLHLTVSRRLLDKLEAARAALSHSHPGAGTDEILEVGLDLVIERHAKRRGLVKRPRAPKVDTVMAAQPGARGKAKAMLEAPRDQAAQTEGRTASQTMGRTEAQAAGRTAAQARAQAETQQEVRSDSASADAVTGSALPDPRTTGGRTGAVSLSPPRRTVREPIPAHVKRAVWVRDGGKCRWPLDSGGVCGSTLRVEIDHFVPVGRGGGSSNVDDLRCLCAFHKQLAARRVFGDAHMERFAGRRQPPAEGLPPRP